MQQVHRISVMTLRQIIVVIILIIVDNSSSSHTDSHQNNFLVLVGCPSYGINGSFGSTEKKFSINFSKAKAKFLLSLQYRHNNSYFFVNV